MHLHPPAGKQLCIHLGECSDVGTKGLWFHAVAVVVDVQIQLIPQLEPVHFTRATSSAHCPKSALLRKAGSSSTSVAGLFYIMHWQSHHRPENTVNNTGPAASVLRTADYLPAPLHSSHVAMNCKNGFSISRSIGPSILVRPKHALKPITSFCAAAFAKMQSSFIRVVVKHRAAK